MTDSNRLCLRSHDLEAVFPIHQAHGYFLSFLLPFTYFHTPATTTGEDGGSVGVSTSYHGRDQMQRLFSYISPHSP